MRSKFEERLAASLTKRGIPYEYETLQLEYYTKVRKGKCSKCGAQRGVIQGHIYTPDFILSKGQTSSTRSESSSSGNVHQQLIIEAKGRFTSSDRTKMKAVKEEHPELDIRFVFMGNNKIHKNSDMRYGDWCDKYNFPWTIKEIPSEWIE